MQHRRENFVASFARILQRILTGLLLAIGIAFCVVTFTPLVKLLVEATEPGWYAGSGEVLVVLGGSMLVPGTGANATLGYDTYLRCVYADWILQRQSFHYVVVTGDSGTAEGMARFLSDRGVPANKIVVENKAKSTYENAVYTQRLLEKTYGVGHLPEVVVLTSDYHAGRARRVFEHAGLHAQAIPVPDILKRFGSRLERWPDFLLLLTEFSKDVAYEATGKL
jgi:uncharacterized SAM-binding protein YcdF (DUF218 family)